MLLRMVLFIWEDTARPDMNACILENLYSRRVTLVLTNTRTYMVVHGALEEVLLTMWLLYVALSLLEPSKKCFSSHVARYVVLLSE